jgi:CRISPR/Cas system Type II protein with McrA/HNH and RuvC-like nuclease domain
MGFTLTHIDKQRLWRKQKYMCPWCLKRITPKQFPDASRDHIIPRSHGGPNVWANMQLMHGWCNKAKGDLCPVCGKHAEVWLPRYQRTSCWQRSIRPYGNPADYPLGNPAAEPGEVRDKMSLPFAQWR